MDTSGVSGWFREYLEAFAACGRGQADIASLLDYYGLPLLITTDKGFFTLTDGDQVVATVQRQVDDMRAAEYAGTQVVESDVAVLNATSALFRGTFSRQRGDGTEIGGLTATYLVTEGASGRRISVMAVHSP